jgi:RimJ/RimL family protein N-acetyltransferase
MVEIQARGFALRPWRKGDEGSLVQYANNRHVWINLTDRFPHPYTRDDAESWIRQVEAQGSPPRNFAIVVEGEAVGGIGLDPLADVNRRTAEVGYWLGEPFWGRGIATEALGLVSSYAFEYFDLDRLQASVFEWNPASSRVLEKSGYALEARIHQSVYKDGQLIDSLLYARLRESPEEAA